MHFAMKNSFHSLQSQFQIDFLIRHLHALLMSKESKESKMLAMSQLLHRFFLGNLVMGFCVHN